MTSPDFPRRGRLRGKSGVKIAITAQETTGKEMQERSFETIEQSFVFSGSRFKIKRVKNLDELVDQIDDELFTEDERLPYWAELWPSAIGFSRFITGHKELIQNKSVLELGCGLGLTSLVLAAQEPASLLVTDYEREALQLTAENFQLNDFKLPNLQETDWRTAELNQKFDVISASDVLYEKRFFEPLLRMFNKHLTPEGIVLLAEPGRPIAEPFFELLTAGNYMFNSTLECVEQDGHEIMVTIYKIKKRV